MPRQRLGRPWAGACRLGAHVLPSVGSKRPGDVGKTDERLVRPGGFARGGHDHEALRCFHPDASDDEGLVLPPQQGDRIVDLRPTQIGSVAAQALDTRAVISLSRTARSPAPVDLIR